MSGWIWLFLCLLTGIAEAAPIEAQLALCEVDFDSAADHFQKLPTVIGPLGPKPAEIGSTVPYSGVAPDGQPVEGAYELARTISQALLVTDYPLQRQVATLTTLPLETRREGDERVVVATPGTPQGEALGCAQVALLPRLLRFGIEESHEDVEVTDEKGRKETVRYYSYDASVTLGLTVYERQGDALVKAAQLTASEESPAAAVAENKSLRLVALPDRHLNAVDELLEASAPTLSTGRPLTVLPTLESVERHPAIDGIQWRVRAERRGAPPIDRSVRYNPAAIEQAVLGAVEDAIQGLRHKSRLRWRTFDRVIMDFNSKKIAYRRRFAGGAMNNLDASHGVQMGHVYWLCPIGVTEPGKCYGWGRVSKPPKGDAPVSLEITAGGRETLERSASSLTGLENPQYGVTFAASVSNIPAQRVAAALPSDPEDGDARSITAGATSNRFAIETYVENASHLNRYGYLRSGLASAGDLSLADFSAGIERRRLIASKTFIFLSGGVSYGRWFVPSGESFEEWDDENDEYDTVEPTASASTFGGEGGAGLVYHFSPSVYIRGLVGGRWMTPARELSWSYTDDDGGEFDGTIVPEASDGTVFRLESVGLVVGVTTAFTF